MIPGNYPSIEVKITIGSRQLRANAVVDTGFDGYVVIPAHLSATLAPPDFHERAEMANGVVIDVPLFLGELELTEAPGSFAVSVIALGDDFLLGLAAINRFRVTFDHGHRLIVER